MKIDKMMTSRPFTIFFILLAPILLPSLLITIPVLKINGIKKEVDLITKKSHQETWSIIQNAATALLPMNSSAIRLAKLATASLGGKTDITFFDIEAKVVPLLFQAMLTIPRVSQISYIRQDGLFFALCFDQRQQIFAVYSNTSFSKATKDRNVYSWYAQPVSFDTGKLHKDAVVFAPRDLINETWVQQALNATDGYTSLGKSWTDDVDNQLVLSTADVDKNGAISLGFELKSLMDVFTGIIPSGSGFYLATKDGKILSNGIPNTRMVLDGNSTLSFHILNANRDQSGNQGDDTTLRLNYATPQSYNLDISGTKYILYSSPIDIIGMPTVYVLALPYEGLQSKMHKNTVLLFMLLSLILVTVTVYVFIFVAFMARAARKQMCVRSALIKQKEVTQEAERKSNNQSLALVNASHDIRAQLAGITGLIEIMLINEVDQGSELAKNLRLMQICSQDLHGILNRILDTSKIEAGKMQLQEKQFNLVKVLEDVVDLFYPVGLKGGVDVVLDLHDCSLTRFSQVEGDDGMLKRILSNLLNNAIKFTSEGYVSVRVWARKPRWQKSTFALNSTQDQCTRCLSCFLSNQNDDPEAKDEVRSDPNCMEFVFEVNDTGKGIPKEKQASVFDNYVQVKETAGELEGTGLGLGIVRSMVRLMGGEISIVNKEVGEKGTCFRFNVVLKVCVSDLSEEDRPNTPFCSPKRQGTSSTVVLFISGDERRRTIQNFLRANGIKVLAVKNIGRLSETLRKFRGQQKSVCSSSSDINISFRYLMGLTSPTQDLHTRPKKGPLSVMDGTDVSPIQGTPQASVPDFILLVIDTTRADFHEVCKAVVEFRKDSNNACSRVVWLGSRCIQLQGLDEQKLPPSDIIIPMPLHGSRLNSLIDLLPEFGGKLPCTPPHKNQRQVGTREENHRQYHHPIQPTSQEEISRILASSSSSSPLRGKRVLVVEDDFVQQTIAKKILAKQGMTIEICKNGQDALKMVSNGLKDQRDLGASHIPPYEYILMDYQMPVMDGCEATREIRLMEEDYGVRIPIIGLTAHAGGGEEVNKLFIAGIDIHVSKPLNEHKVLKAIEDLHSRK